MKYLNLDFLVNLLMKSKQKCKLQDCNSCNKKQKVFIKSISETDYKVQTEICDEAIEYLKNEFTIEKIK